MAWSVGLFTKGGGWIKGAYLASFGGGIFCFVSVVFFFSFYLLTLASSFSFNFPLLEGCLFS